MSKLLETQTAYAKRHGVSKMAVNKWQKRGLLVLDGRLVDVEASDKNLEKYRSAPRSDGQGFKSKPESKPKSKPDSKPDNQKPEDSIPTTGGIFGKPKAELDRLYRAQQVLLAELEKKQAKWDADLREGKLLDADEVERINSTRCLGLRNKLLAIPSEYAIRLANCKEPAQAAAILRDAICDALNDFLTEYGIVD